MKKIIYILMAAAVLFSGCKKVSSSIDETKIGQLALDLSFNASYEAVTKAEAAPDKNDFTVNIVRSDGWSVSYKYGEMPSVLPLSAADYTITAIYPDTHTPAAFNQPVFEGTDSFTIKTGKVSTAKLDCSLSNVKISLLLDGSFIEELSTYDITISNGDGAENKLVWTSDATVTESASLTADLSKAGYFSVAPIKVLVSGYRALDNSAATFSATLTDVKPMSHYSLTLKANATGQFGGVDITISTETTDVEQDVTVPGFDITPVPGEDDEDDDDEGDDEPEITEPNIIVNWEGRTPDAKGVYPTEEIVEGIQVNLTIQAFNAIKEFVVTINSENATFAGLVGEMSSNGEPVLDLINDAKAVESMGGLGLPVGDQLYNVSDEVPFSLSTLIPMISMVAPPETEHAFILSVTDMKGETLERTLVFRTPAEATSAEE